MISQPKPQRVSASALDDRLSGPEGVALKNEYIKKLETHWSKVLQAKNKGDLNPTEFKAAEHIGNAILHALVILNNYIKLQDINK